MSFGRLGSLGRGFGRLGSGKGGSSVPPGTTLIAGSDSYVWSGDTMTPLVDYVLPVDGGSYTYTGQTASLLAQRLITASGGSYTFTGQNATLSVGGTVARQFMGSSAYLNLDTTARQFMGYETYVVN